MRKLLNTASKNVIFIIFLHVTKKSHGANFFRDLCIPNIHRDSLVANLPLIILRSFNGRSHILISLMARTHSRTADPKIDRKVTRSVLTTRYKLLLSREKRFSC